MRVLGIDPGLAKMGFGIVEGDYGTLVPVSYGYISTKSTDRIGDRLKQIYREVSEIIEKRRPDVLAMEDLFFNQNARSAFTVGQARGVAGLAAAEQGLDVVDYSPLEIKMAVCGYGRATKEQVQYMVKGMLGLSETPRPDHAADALAVAICHLQANRMKREIEERLR